MTRDSLQTQTQRLLRRYGLHARKGLGQHFLIDRAVLDLIVETAQLTTNDLVVEVGPGLGVLTRELAERAGRVAAIELDDKLAAILEDSLKPFPNVTIINQDVLKVDVPSLLKELRTKNQQLTANNYKLVANLPYYITSPVLRHFLEAEIKPKTMVVMVQKEVAEEIAAGPGRMSLLSIGVQLYGAPEIIAPVPAASFYPAPAVDSAILKITPYSRPPVEISDVEGFFALARAGFSAARKQLANSLANGLGVRKEQALALLAAADIDPRRRAEALSLEEWARLWKLYSAGRDAGTDKPQTAPATS
jgi:16S rRNA (adenine1518-N6/adenine1519-N6)-dimethyltransferase